MMQRWIAQMNPRERKLALTVGGLLFLLINFALWSALFGMSASARSQYAEQRNLREGARVAVVEHNSGRCPRRRGHGAAAPPAALESR